MTRRWLTAVLSLCSGLLLAGCAETPKQPVMRPIPPPPSTPPLIYVPQSGVVSNAPAVTSLPGNTAQNVPATINQDNANYEVSSNFVGNAQTPISTQASVVSTNQTGLPQYEIVPERPGPDYIWRDGYWQWQGTAWVWVSGQWIYQPPSVVVVPGYYGGWYYGPHYRYYGGRPYRYGPHRHW